MNIYFQTALASVSFFAMVIPISYLIAYEDNKSTDPNITHTIKKYPYIINDVSGQHYVEDFDVVGSTLTYVDEEGNVKMDKSFAGVTITFRGQHTLDTTEGRR